MRGYNFKHGGLTTIVFNNYIIFTGFTFYVKPKIIKIFYCGATKYFRNSYLFEKNRLHSPDSMRLPEQSYENMVNYEDSSREIKKNGFLYG